MSRLTKALLIALAVLVIATIALSYGPGWIRGWWCAKSLYFSRALGNSSLKPRSDFRSQSPQFYHWQRNPRECASA